MQRFAGINETGELDEGTVALMKRKRCGMPDLIGSSERIKLYDMQGKKWSKNSLTWRLATVTILSPIYYTMFLQDQRSFFRVNKILYTEQDLQPIRILALLRTLDSLSLVILYTWIFYSLPF
ncbi:matrix metalloproteinase-17-like isoform X1 [Tachypleus tridentatus]|uniref:matrix metalloproteinase-17-like isoform X1 n=1 Tax=Tachypleus tridentatus TaxID=6853 RepID=UPI003FD2016E